MADMTITREDSGSKARYIAKVEGVEEVGELTLSILSERTVIADHTGVPDALRGTGVGKALVERLIADMRESGQKIVPLCPYVRAYAERHKAETADVIQW